MENNIKKIEVEERKIRFYCGACLTVVIAMSTYLAFYGKDLGNIGLSERMDMFFNSMFASCFLLFGVAFIAAMLQLIVTKIYRTIKRFF